VPEDSNDELSFGAIVRLVLVGEILHGFSKSAETQDLIKAKF